MTESTGLRCMPKLAMSAALRSGCLAGLLLVSACGDVSRNKAEVANEGLVVELPEPAAPPVKAAAPVKAEAIDGKEAPVTDAPSERLPEKAVEEPKPKKAESEPQPAEEAPPADEAPRPAPQAAPARALLPDAVIARTLDRIGFPCGSVTSSARMEGSDDPTALKVTCSSGQTYRASSKTGRYRFNKARRED